MGTDRAERAEWKRGARGWGSGPRSLTRRPQRRLGRGRTAGPPDVSVFHREDVGWWRSWLQQSYQAVKEKVSRASTLLPSAGHRADFLQPSLASPAWIFRAPLRPLPYPLSNSNISVCDYHYFLTQVGRDLSQTVLGLGLMGRQSNKIAA